MTRATRRRSAGRLAFQLALLAPLGSAIFGGCSSGVKTVSVDCPTGGTGALGGGQGVNAGASSGASAGVLGMAGEAGQGQGQAGAEGGEGGGAASSQGGEAGEAGSSIGGRGGSSGTGGHSGGHGGTAGGSAGAPAVAFCGDKVTTPPEFCDDGTNTDLSYGCSACTTLPEGKAPQGAMQCDACLAGKSLTGCELCKDYRACYGCLREQASAPRFASSKNCNGDDDDTPDDFDTHKSFSDRCFDPSNSEYQAATGGPAGSKSRGLVCQAMVACILRTGCATGQVSGRARTVFADCFCGDGDCGNATFMPHGPCVNEILNADAPSAGMTATSVKLEVATNVADPSPGNHWSALGVAQQIVYCASDPCADVCYPNSSSTGGAGGSAGTAGVGGSSGHGGS